MDIEFWNNISLIKSAIFFCEVISNKQNLLSQADPEESNKN